MRDARSRCLFPLRACSRRPCIRRQAHAHCRREGKEQAIPREQTARLARAAQRLTCLRPRGMTCWLTRGFSAPSDLSSRPLFELLTSNNTFPCSLAGFHGAPTPVWKPVKPCRGTNICNHFCTTANCAQGVPCVSKKLKSDHHGLGVATMVRALTLLLVAALALAALPITTQQVWNLPA